MNKELVNTIDEYIMSRMMTISHFVRNYESILEQSINYHKEIILNSDIPDVSLDELRNIVVNEPTWQKLGEVISVAYSKKEILLAQSLYKSLGYHAIFLLSYSYFEHSLGVICNTIKLSNKLEISWRDLKGSTLEAIKSYLSKVIRIEFDFGQNKDWVMIYRYLQIRNIIAHTGNIVSDQELASKILIQIEKLNGISLSNQNEIIIENEFIQESLSVYVNFFAALLKSLKEAT